LRRKIVSGIILMLLVLSLNFSSKVGKSNIFQPTSTETVVRFEPRYVNVAVGQTFMLTVFIDNVTLLYGFDLQITWNTTFLAHVNHTATIPVETYLKGLLHEPILQLKNQVDENNSIPGAESGTLYWIAVSSMPPAPSFNGSGSAFTITFKALDHIGITTLNFTNVQLSNPDAQVILYTSLNCVVDIISYPVHNINTGLDYAAIQEAIDAPETESGHTISVDAGTYYENVVVNKAVSLIGEDKDATVIGGNQVGTVVTMESNNVEISGFTLMDSGAEWEGSWWDSAILLNCCSNTLIQNNNIINNWCGIWLQGSTSNTIAQNYITENYMRGIVLVHSTNNTIVENDATNNGEGVYIGYSSNNNLTNNVMIGNQYNFGVFGETLDHFIQDVDTSNIVDGRPIYYWIDHVNERVPVNAGYVALVNSVNITVEDVTLTNNIQGVLIACSRKLEIRNSKFANNVYGVNLVDSVSNIITKSNMTSNIYGVGFRQSSNNAFTENTVTNNTDGVLLLYSSNNNTITGNNITANRKCGIDLTASTSNVISENNIGANSNYGIWLASSSNNTFYHNNLVDNTNQVYLENSFNNTWDNGCEGNYWSDYDGADLDGNGIGDTWYIINEDNIDNYPLMNLYWNPADINHDLDINIYDAVRVLVAYGSKLGDEDYDCRCDIAEPYGTINLYDAVLVLVNYGKKYS
jgi:parallel beta-helix repeat protein